MSPRLIFVVSVTAVAALICVTAAAAKPATTAKGVYTEEQAAQGATLYRNTCAMCHGAGLMGTFEIPTLVGRFVHNWSNGSVGALFDYVSRAMPQMAPGSLSPENNAKIVAFLLKANGMPAGDKPLPSDQAMLDAIAFTPVRTAGR